MLSRGRVETDSELALPLLLPTALFVGLRQTGELKLNLYRVKGPV